MAYEYKCEGIDCDFESNDKLSVELCEKRHLCTDAGHQQIGLIFDLKVLHTKCDCGKETPDAKELSVHHQQQFTKELHQLKPLTDLIKKYYGNLV